MIRESGKPREISQYTDKRAQDRLMLFFVTENGSLPYKKQETENMELSKRRNIWKLKIM